MMEFDYSVVFAYITGIFILYMLGKLMIEPIKAGVKAVYKAALGGVALFAINLIGGLFQFHIALNLVTVLIVGFLGIPGLALLVVLKYVFGI